MNKKIFSTVMFGFAVASAYAETSVTANDLAFKISGATEVKAYVDDAFASGDLSHRYETVLDLFLDVQLNDKWSAYAGVEAKTQSEQPTLLYNGAWLKYQHNDNLFVKAGDLSHYEGQFVAYYGYDFPYDWDAGMKAHDIRGFELNWNGLLLAAGFGRGGNDKSCPVDYKKTDPLKENCETKKSYDVHAAYELNYAGQHLRPYAHYKSFQTAEHNELHAGVEASLAFGGFSFRTVYGFHADYLMDDGDAKENFDATSTAHSLLVEPVFEMGMFKIKTSFFYAFLNNDDDGRNEIENDVPEYMFAYAEPMFRFAEILAIGLPVEFHTNTLDSDKDLNTINVGGRIYFGPAKKLHITAFGLLGIPMGENKNDETLKLGLETIFSF